MISPSDAAVAVRTFPRRWRALFAMAEGDDERSTVLERSGALRMASDAAAVLERTADRIRGGLPSAPGETVLDHLDAACAHLATAIENVARDDWAGERIQALSNGIDDAARLLREAERAIDEAR